MTVLSRRDVLRRGGATAIAGAAATALTILPTANATPIANLYARFERLQRFWRGDIDDDTGWRVSELQSRLVNRIAVLPARNEHDLYAKIRLLGEYTTELQPWPNEPKLVAPKVYASLMRDVERLAPGGTS